MSLTGQSMQTDVKTNIKMPDSIAGSASPDEATITDFLSQVELRLGQGANTIQLDCAPLVRVTSRHINALWLIREICSERGARIELRNVSDGLRRVLEALDLAELFLRDAAVPYRLDLRIAADVTDINDGMSRLVRFLMSAGVPEGTAFELQTVFYEVTTNIRLHGRLPSQGVIKCDAQVRAQTATFTFVDDGVRFDPTSYEAAVDFQQAGLDLQSRGFGLAMIRRLSDCLEYSRTVNDENRLKIKKSW